MLFSFEDQVVSRGHRYFLQGRIEKAFINDSGLIIRITVQGSYRYHVYIEWLLSDQKSVKSFCSCPYFTDGYLCKHIWAGIKFLDSEDIYKVVPGEGEIRVFPDPQLELKCVAKKFSAFDSRLFNLGSEISSRTNIISEENFSWKKQIVKIQNAFPPKTENTNPWDRPKKPRIGYYFLDLEGSKISEEIIIEFWAQKQNQKGVLGALNVSKVSEDDISSYSDPRDRELIALLIAQGQKELSKFYYSYSSRNDRPITKVNLPHSDAYGLILKKLVETGRFYLKENLPYGPHKNHTPISVDIEKFWSFSLKLEAASEEVHILSERLTRDSSTLPLTSVKLWLNGGYFLANNTIFRTSNLDHKAWTQKTKIVVPNKEIQAFAGYVYATSGLPPIDLPLEAQWPTIEVVPKVRLLFRTRNEVFKEKEISFDIELNYNDKFISHYDRQKNLVNQHDKKIIKRNFEKEQAILENLYSLGAQKLLESSQQSSFIISEKLFLQFTQDCLKAGFLVMAEGKQIRTGSDFNISIATGVDWFDLGGGVKFDKEHVNIPDLIQALEKGETFITLGDGTLGLLPKEWLKKYSSLAALGEAKEGSIRFKSAQGFLLDSWLAHDKDLLSDELFKKYQKNLKSCITAKELAPPKGFNGKLRPYQKVGLSWINSLSKIEMGGILADDMGLGKTVQVLAFLESTRLKKKNPILIVAPKSLIFNWIDEAKKFAPKLRVLDYTGLDRRSKLNNFDKYDIILTTYHTMRIDIEALKEKKFNSIIIDEAQAIKNSGSLNTKASLLLKGDFKLAMTGTPIENSVKDLFSILNFVNPSLIPTKIQDSWIQKGHNVEKESTRLLSNALRPLILRRTKEQVLKDLPAKSEQVLYCELEGKQKKDYEKLRDFYRINLKEKIDIDGLNKSKIQILTALLRLRQAACHPGLVDPARIKEGSAKLEVLVAQLKEITAENHKALVFSQFTSFLAIVKDRLDRENIKYLYLDGQTQNRKECVEIFQNDKSIPVFLLSLKAGGMGLNLTAADYVFLLDPWWNPAVEAQAIDRTHRIGQKNKVMAYKFIAKNTVEEKILELQKSKKQLFDSVITTDENLIKKMSMDDLQMLLS
jgi:superfamily II DNA or RNA helicase